jgi:hypothetical protein
VLVTGMSRVDLIVIAASSVVLIGVPVLAGDLVGLLFVPALMVAAVFIARRARAYSADRLRREGVPTRGVIIGLSDTQTSEVDHFRTASYRYRGSGGREFTGYTRPIPLDGADRWGVGDEIDVSYDPQQPERSFAFDRA